MHIFIRSFAIIKKKKTKSDAMRIEEEMKKKKKYALPFLFANVRCLTIIGTQSFSILISTRVYTRTERTIEKEKASFIQCTYCLKILT